MTHQSANFVIMKVHKVSSLLPYTHLSAGDGAALLAPFRCIDKGLRQPNAKFHIVVAASPFPTSWWLFSLSASFTCAITKVTNTAWPAGRVHYPSWSYRVNEGSLRTSCHRKVGNMLQNEQALTGKKKHSDEIKLELTYVNNFTEDWRGICGGTIPTFFFKLFLALGDSQVCAAPESRDEVRLRLAHAHLLRGQARNSVTSRQIAIASGAERRNPHPPWKQSKKPKTSALPPPIKYFPIKLEKLLFLILMNGECTRKVILTSNWQKSCLERHPTTTHIKPSISSSP